jgi:hypothetical protein
MNSSAKLSRSAVKPQPGRPSSSFRFPAEVLVLSAGHVWSSATIRIELHGAGKMYGGGCRNLWIAPLQRLRWGK